MRLRANLGHLDPRERGAEADARSHALIAAALADARPMDAILSEEGSDDLTRLAATRVWIIDPLDGTREYSEAERPDWAVHVALAVDGRVACGAVAIPALGRTLSSDRAVDAPAQRPPPLRIVASRTRAPALVALLADHFAAEVIPMGSAGAKTGAVISGEAHAYVHAGGQWEWDVAAPAAVAEAVGLHVSRLDGSRLRFNQPHPWSPDLLVCRTDIAERFLDALSGLSPTLEGVD